MPPTDRTRLLRPRLLGRARERARLDTLVSDVRGGASAVLVIAGESGVGKTALLDHVSREAVGFRVIWVTGTEAEAGLPYAGLHQLWAPMLDQIGSLPEPQAAAINVALGRSEGDRPERFLVALATLGLLTAVARERPFMCIADDVQWLDADSMQVLGFVARRLGAAQVGIVCAVREPSDRGDLTGLPELQLEGLAPADAQALVSCLLPGPIDAGVLDRIIDETRGNPLALRQLVSTPAAATLAGGFGVPAATVAPAQIEREVLRVLDALPPEARLLLVLAAADPVGDLGVIRRGIDNLGISRDVLMSAVDAGLIECDSRVRFQRPLVRSLVYRSATRQERHAVHRALARATDSAADPDRRAWHLGQATLEPAEPVAATLEQSAAHAGRRGGLPARAAFLERAAVLTPERSRRAHRFLAAAWAKRDAGTPEAAARLLSAIEPEHLDILARARLDALHALIVFDRRDGREAARLLAAAARRLEPLALDLARQAHLDALHAAMWGGGREGPSGAHAVARGALAAPRAATEPGPTDLLLDALARLLVAGYTEAAGCLRQSLERATADTLPSDDRLDRLPLTAAGCSVIVALELWDACAWHRLASRHEQVARDAGALAHRQIAIGMLAWSHIARGRLDEAELVVTESRTAATEQPPLLDAGILLAAFRGDGAETIRAIEAVERRSTADGLQRIVAFAAYARAVLDNAHGCHASARDAIRDPFAADHAGYGPFLAAELAEAAARTGDVALLQSTLAWIGKRTRATPTDWSLGIEARIRALLNDESGADDLYRQSIERLRRTPIRTELARTHLLYGEWLRRGGRRLDAREQLGLAHEMFRAMGMSAFTERSRRELTATGASARRRAVETRDELTAQERQIAELARDGLSNPEIGARLFLSPRTVEWHLRKVFSKLGIRSRRELARSLPADSATADPALASSVCDVN